MTAPRRKLPEHIPGTIREWRKKKRSELVAARKALHTFLIGCAYTPAQDIGIAYRILKDNERRLSQKAWGK